MWLGNLIAQYMLRNPLKIGSNNKLQFRDTGIYINSGADGKLTISADGGGADDITLSGGVTLDTAPTLNGTALAATFAELNAAADISSNVGTMTASTVMAALLTAYNVTTFRTGNIIKTTMYVDLQSAKSTTPDKDIIGNTGVCHIGRVTAAVNGAIFAGQVSCAEVPTTGQPDIDLYSATAADGAYDADGSALAGAKALMVAGGNHAIGTVKPFTVLPAANDYLYLLSGAAGTAGTYAAGILVIEMWGLAS